MEASANRTCVFSRVTRGLQFAGPAESYGKISSSTCQLAYRRALDQRKRDWGPKWVARLWDLDRRKMAVFLRKNTGEHHKTRENHKAHG